MDKYRLDQLQRLYDHVAALDESDYRTSDTANMSWEELARYYDGALGYVHDVLADILSQ